MEKTLTPPSKQRCADSPPTIESLVSEWVAKLAINAGQSLDAKTQAVYCSIWLEGLSDLPPAVLLAAFRKTLRECPYWPVKVADIRKHVTRAIQNETDDAAERAWQAVLEIRRCHWSPDVPGPFNRALANLTERVRQAARAAGIWRDFTASEYENGAMHTWAKKRFFESFLAWGERDEDNFLLPDGEVKKLLIRCAESKAIEPKLIPAPKQPPEERLRVADALASAAREVIAAYKPKETLVTVSDETRLAVRQQAELIRRKYPDSKTPPELQRFILEPAP
jgi:hypothetical protein